MDINELIDIIKKNIMLLVREKIKYKNEILTIATKYRDELDKEILDELPDLIYNIHNELLYLADIYKILSKLYI